MSDNMATGIVTIVLGILGVATLAVILSPKANTAGVISAGGNALANNILAATGPVTGASGSINTGSSGSFLNLPALNSSAFGG